MRDDSMRKTGTRLMTTALAVATAFSIGTARAADKVDVDAAKKEGKVVWYTSTPIKTAQELAVLFEKQTGVHVELFRSGGSAILRRFMQENKAGLHAADVMTTSDPAASAKLAKDGLFVPFKPEAIDKVPDVAKDPNGAYVAQRLNMMVIYIRSDKLDKADYPKTWTDVLDPKYQGKLVMTDPSFTALQLMVVSTLSRKLGWGITRS
jgi:iron(III) transport system substrate-binding protein